MDGTLVDTEHIHYSSYYETLQNYGITISPEEYFDLWTRQGKRFKDYMELKNLELDYDKVIWEKRHLFNQKLVSELVVYPHAVETVKELSARMPLALVTGSHRVNVDMILKITGLEGCFKYILTGDDHSKHKPDPEGFLMAADALRIEPSSCLVIEDAQKGIISANRAGMKSIAIPNKYTKTNDFSTATKVLGSISEITDELLNSL